MVSPLRVTLNSSVTEGTQLPVPPTSLNPTLTEVTILDGQYQLSVSIDLDSLGNFSSPKLQPESPGTPLMVLSERSWPRKSLQFILTFQLLQIVFTITLIMLIIFVLHRLNKIQFFSQLFIRRRRSSQPAPQPPPPQPQPPSQTVASSSTPTSQATVNISKHRRSILINRPSNPVSSAGPSHVDTKVTMCQMESNSSRSSGSSDHQLEDGHSLMSIGTSVTGHRTISECSDNVTPIKHNCIPARCLSCLISSDQQQRQNSNSGSDGGPTVLKSLRFWQSNNIEMDNGSLYPGQTPSQTPCTPALLRSNTQTNVCNSGYEEFELAIEQSFDRLFQTIRS